MLTSSHALLATLCVGAVTSIASSALAQDVEPVLEIDAQLVRRYGIPATFDPFAAGVATSATDVVWAATTGIDRAASCVLVHVGQQGATALTYRHQDRPTACSSLALGEPGEIFLRGVDPTIMNNAVPSGFTAALDAAGALEWSIDDTVLVNAAPRSEGGTGGFIGEYGGVSGLLAYQPEQRALMAFSVGALKLGLRATPVTQAHIVEVETGRLRRTGQGFGANGAGLVAGVLPEPGGEDFLLYERFVTGVGGDFYRYDGRSSIDAFEPFDVSWSERTLLGFDANAQLGVVALLWVDGPSTNERVHLSMITASGEPLFEVDLSGVLLDALGNAVELERPVRLVTGSRYTVVVYSVGGLRYVRVFRSATGEFLGGFYLEDLVDVDNILGAVRVGEQGELVLVRWDRARVSLEEYAWEIVEGQEPVDDMGVGGVDMSSGSLDMGALTDMGPSPEGRIEGSEFCAMAPLHYSRPAPLAVLAVLGCMVGLWSRKRRVSSDDR